MDSHTYEATMEERLKTAVDEDVRHKVQAAQVSPAASPATPLSIMKKLAKLVLRSSAWRLGSFQASSSRTLRSSSSKSPWAPWYSNQASQDKNISPPTAAVRHDGGHVLCAREVTSSGAVTYVLGMRPSSIASSMKGKEVVFVDLPKMGSQLMPGRPFGMVEGEGGIVVTLESPVTGEVVKVNERLLQEPWTLARGDKTGGGATSSEGGEGGYGWLVRVDPFLNVDVDDPDFAKMGEGP